MSKVVRAIALICGLWLTLDHFGLANEAQIPYRINRLMNTSPPDEPEPPGGDGDCNGTWEVTETGYIWQGVYCPEGAVSSAQGLQVGSFTTQTDVYSTWESDGSVRHAVLRFNATSTGMFDVTTITRPGGSYTPTWPSATAVFTISAGAGASNTYTATLGTFDSTDCAGNGSVARDCWKIIRPQTGGGTLHDNIQVKFEAICFNGAGCYIGYGIQNIRNVSTMNSSVANVVLNIDGGPCYSQSNAMIHTGTRWYRSCTSGISLGEVIDDKESWIATDIIPRISPNVFNETYPIHCNNITDINGGHFDDGMGGCTYSYGNGLNITDQATSENFGRDELTPFNDWDARWFALRNPVYRIASILNARQSGGWTNAIDNDGDGKTIPKITDPGKSGFTTEFASLGGTSGGWNWPTDGICYWRGDNIGGCSESFAFGISAGVNKEHNPESNFIPFLETGEQFYLDNLRFQAAWNVFLSYGQYIEADNILWPGYFRGRNGTKSYLNDAEMGRSFGRPLRVISRAAIAMPDVLSGDRDYFIQMVDDNLEAVGIYMDYIASKGWDSSPYFVVGMNPSGEESGTWNVFRTNSCSSVSAGNPSIVTCIGDDSGIGTGTNDIGHQNGDCILFSGFSGGASNLNGRRCGVTRTSALQISVPVSTSGTSTGTYYYRTGQYFSHWRNAVSAWEISYICFSGFWTCAANELAFPDKMAQLYINMMQTCDDIDTKPGYYFNYYPVPGRAHGSTFTPYTSCDEWANANDPTDIYGATGDLLQSQFQYPGGDPRWTHRGNVGGWGVPGISSGAPNEYYTVYAIPVLLHGRRRSISGADAAYSALIAATGVENSGLKARPGFYWTMP